MKNSLTPSPRTRQGLSATKQEASLLVLESWTTRPLAFMSRNKTPFTRTSAPVRAHLSDISTLSERDDGALAHFVCPALRCYDNIAF